MRAMDSALDTIVTFDDFLALPETNVPCEFVDGVAIVTSVPTPRHQLAATELGRILAEAAPPGLRALAAPVDWVLSRDPLHVRQPDVTVLTGEQVRAPRLESPPLLAVEILSPTSHERDLVTKARAYAAAGLAWYWVVDPHEPAILVLRNRGRRPARAHPYGTFVRHARASGDEVLRLDEPFPLELRPSQLIP